MGVPTWVYDNGHESVEGLAVLSDHDKVVDSRGWPFYRMWNDAWNRSHSMGYDVLAVLNDDIVLHPESLLVAAQDMMNNPDVGVLGLNWGRPVSSGISYTEGIRYVSGSRRHGGIGGHAFLVRCALWGSIPPIDEAYHIWYGDDELFFNTERYGYRCALSLGSPVDHKESTTLNQSSELLSKTGDDRLLFTSKFGDI